MIESYDSLNELSKDIINFFDQLGYHWPNFQESMMFAETELSEVYELILARDCKWAHRNHPECKPEFSEEALAEELGDAIMMLIVAGLYENVDPITALYDKMNRKLEEKNNRSD